MKRLIKNEVVKIQNLVVNHESRPVKSNPETVIVILSDIDVQVTAMLRLAIGLCSLIKVNQRKQSSTL